MSGLNESKPPSLSDTHASSRDAMRFGGRRFLVPVRRVRVGFVFEQRRDGICPVSDIVLVFLITDRPEGRYQDVQLQVLRVPDG